MAQTCLLTQARVSDVGMFSVYIRFLQCFWIADWTHFGKLRKKSPVLRTGIRTHNINSALWITTPIRNNYKHFEVITTNSEVLHPLMSYHIQLNEKNWTTIQNVHVRSSSTGWLGSAYDVTAVRAGALSRALRPEALFGKTHVSYSLPLLTAQLVLIETAPYDIKRENCSQRFCVLLEVQP